MFLRMPVVFLLSSKDVVSVQINSYTHLPHVRYSDVLFGDC